MLLLMYDDLFAVMRFIGREIPSPMWFLVFLVVISVFLTYVKWNTDQRMNRDRWILEHPELDIQCTFPLCGRTIDRDREIVVSQLCADAVYCCKECRRRDASENNHRSLALLLKYRREELAKKKEAEDVEKQKPILQHLADLLPDPLNIVPQVDPRSSKVSRQVELEAATMTARRFCEAYVEKYGLAVHHWAFECHEKSGRGCVLIHLSEKAMDYSGGSPLSYVPRRLLLPLDDYRLNEIVREYRPSQELVLYILQRGIDKSHIAVPFRYEVYTTPGKAKQEAKGGGDDAAARDKTD